MLSNHPGATHPIIKIVLGKTASAARNLKKKLVEQTSKWHLRDNHASIYMIYISDPPFPGPVSISVIK